MIDFSSIDLVNAVADAFDKIASALGALIATAVSGVTGYYTWKNRYELDRLYAATYRPKDNGEPGPMRQHPKALAVLFRRRHQGVELSKTPSPITGWGSPAKKPERPKMTVFDQAMNYLLKNEGGFVNDPADPGGVTNMGITLSSLSVYLGYSASTKEIAMLSRSEAEKIYSRLYWGPMRCDAMEQPEIAIAVFDTGVLFGAGASVQSAQRALRQCGYAHIDIDGHIGAQTLAALNEVVPSAFIEQFQLGLRERVKTVVHYRPTVEKFVKGWENRIDLLSTLVSKPSGGKQCPTTPA